MTLVEMGLQVRPVPSLAEAAVFERAARAIVHCDHSAAAAGLSWHQGTGVGSCIHQNRAAVETQTWLAWALTWMHSKQPMQLNPICPLQAAHVCLKLLPHFSSHVACTSFPMPVCHVSGLVSAAHTSSRRACHAAPSSLLSSESAFVELLQVLQQEGVRLLMCAPKNFSADLLCSALGQAGITKKAMLRLNDPRHPPPQVTASLQNVLCVGQPAQGSCWGF